MEVSAWRLKLPCVLFALNSAAAEFPDKKTLLSGLRNMEEEGARFAFLALLPSPPPGTAQS